jgi:hypothetical protein
MNWDAIVAKVMPSIVKIETPSGHGTGFLCFYNEARNICGIATAHHVIAHADRWQEPIRIISYQTKTQVLLKEADRVIWSGEEKDSAVLLCNVGDLKLPEIPVGLFPADNRLAIGVEVAWLGYPGIAEDTLCFFSGNVSAILERRSAYFIDGVAINGVSGGPVIHCRDTSSGDVQIVGAISAYRANRATGEVLPGLSIAQDVSHFQASATFTKNLDEANRQKEAAEAEAASPKSETVSETAELKTEPSPS